MTLCFGANEIPAPPMESFTLHLPPPLSKSSEIFASTHVPQMCPNDSILVCVLEMGGVDIFRNLHGLLFYKKEKLSHQKVKP